MLDGLLRRSLSTLQRGYFTSPLRMLEDSLLIQAKDELISTRRWSLLVENCCEKNVKIAFLDLEAFDCEIIR